MAHGDYVRPTRAEAERIPRRIELFVYDETGAELRHDSHDGNMALVRDLDDTLTALFKRWQGY